MSILLYYAALVGGDTPTAPGFRVRDSAGNLLADFGDDENQDGTRWAIDIGALGLAPGQWLLSVTRVNRFGCESEPVDIALTVGENGAPVQRTRQPRQVTLAPRASGQFRGSWTIEGVDAGVTDPTGFEWALQGDEHAPNAVAFDRQLFVHSVDVPAQPHGVTRRLGVRSLRDGVPGPWFYSRLAAADAEGPGAAMLVPGPSGSC